MRYHIQLHSDRHSQLFCVQHRSREHDPSGFAADRGACGPRTIARGGQGPAVGASKVNTSVYPRPPIIAIDSFVVSWKHTTRDIVQLDSDREISALLRTISIEESALQCIRGWERIIRSNADRGQEERSGDVSLTANKALCASSAHHCHRQSRCDLLALRCPTQLIHVPSPALLRTTPIEEWGKWIRDRDIVKTAKLQRALTVCVPMRRAVERTPWPSLQYIALL